MLPHPKAIRITDNNLAAAIRKALGISSKAPITQLDMLSLFELNHHGKFDAKWTRNYGFERY